MSSIEEEQALEELQAIIQNTSGVQVEVAATSSVTTSEQAEKDDYGK